jgi:hypothetical protein
MKSIVMMAQSIQRLGVGLGVLGIRIRFPAGSEIFALLHCVQTGSEAHTFSYSVGTGSSFLGGNAAGS